VWKDLGVPTTLLLTSFYWENFIYFGMGPKAGPDGTLAIGMPMGDRKLSGISAGDIGACAYGIFKAGNEYIGKTVGIAGDHVSGADMAAALSKALSKKVVYHAMEPAAYRALGFPGADDLGNMFQYKTMFEREFRTSRDLAVSRELYPRMQTFAQWLEANRERIPLD